VAAPLGRNGKQRNIKKLVRGRPSVPLSVIAAFRTWGDERLKIIADIASKNNMRVEGLTS
jgi:hypothetical protein